jgi:tungstate transport system substrate-binding protein
MRFLHLSVRLMAVFLLGLALADERLQAQLVSRQAVAGRSVRLATTTSMEQSGLLEVLLPAFARRYGYKVNVIAVGSGAALTLAEHGDCDIVISHAPRLEEAFMAKGLGDQRLPLMYSDFILLGPARDPAGAAKSAGIVEAFRNIAEQKARFISRGDNSGTHQKEREIWELLPAVGKGAWYCEAGQGMAEALHIANQLDAYILSDRATYLALRQTLPHLRILVQGDRLLRNEYSVIIVNPARHLGLNADGARALANFLLDKEAAAIIASYSIQGEQCFFIDKQGAAQ